MSEDSKTTARRQRAIGPPTLIWGAIALLLAVDLSRPPGRQASARTLLSGIHLYQQLGRGPTAALGVSCRFTPTCSRYAEAAVRQDGALFGGLRAAWRILRCGPWTAKGTVDPA